MLMITNIYPRSSADFESAIIRVITSWLSLPPVPNPARQVAGNKYGIVRNREYIRAAFRRNGIGCAAAW
jgi:hypothetical protein